MRIIQVAAEMAPIAKVGGLGDVIHGLSRELAGQKHKVEIILPKYDCIKKSRFDTLKLEKKIFFSSEKGKKYPNRVYRGKIQGIAIILIDPLPPKNYFRRLNIYGYKNDVARFSYFSQAALEYLLSRNETIDILHLHDWHTALMAPLYKDVFASRGLKIKGLMFTIHNLAYQGKCVSKDLDNIGLSGKKYLTPGKLQDDKNKKTVNLLKGGLTYADAVTTVSPAYAKEILTSESGCNLDRTLRRCRKKLKGILNGIDSDFWNPQKDRFIKGRYSSKNSVAQILSAKARNRDALKIRPAKRPLIGAVCRLVPQKGPGLIKHAISRSLKKRAQFVLLGSSPIKKITAEFNRLKKELKDNPDVRLNFNFDEAFSHLVYSACDFFLVPSYFEPCGLTQLIALRYGAIPIVRKTGGLSDTIFDVDDPNIPSSQKNGYTFERFNMAGVNSALDRAINCWYERPAKFKKLVEKAMRLDYSWKKSAARYLEEYKKIIEQKPS